MWPREKYSEHPSWLTHPKNTIVPFISRRHAELWRLYYFCGVSSFALYIDKINFNITKSV